MTLLLLFALLAVPQPAQELTFRVRLFSIAQPSIISLTPDGKPTHQIRAASAQLLVDGRQAQAPLRIAPPATLRVQGDEPVRVQSPVEISVRDGKLFIVGLIPREEYVAGVVAGEAGGFRSENALKAMAVAARTYATHFLSRHKAEGFDFCDTTHCQDYRGTAIPPRVRKAVTDTSGELVWQSGKPIEAYYHQDCGGITEGQIHDPYCISRGKMQWTAELTRENLKSIFDVRSPTNVEIVSRTSSGRASKVRIEGTPSRTLDAEMFRLSVGRTLGWNLIRSDLYHIRRNGDLFVFEGYGAGHGIGLCQDGAAVMGEMGKSYREILAFYYPNTAVSTTAGGISWLKLRSTKADMETTGSQDSDILDAVERLMSGLERSANRTFTSRPLIRVYPSLDAYRNATGEPGWMAASTKNNVIRLQPAASLKARNILDSTLRHELAHVLIESRARPGEPLWFREGIVLWLTQPAGTGSLPSSVHVSSLERTLTNPGSETQLRQAYREAQSAIEILVRNRGKDSVLNWIERGVPVDLPEPR